MLSNPFWYCNLPFKLAIIQAIHHTKLLQTSWGIVICQVQNSTITSINHESINQKSTLTMKITSTMSISQSTKHLRLPKISKIWGGGNKSCVFRDGEDRNSGGGEDMNEPNSWGSKPAKRTEIMEEGKQIEGFRQWQVRNLQANLTGEANSHREI